MRFALGIVNFIKDALLRHKRDHADMPRRIVVHPAAISAMMSETTPSNWAMLMGPPEEDGTRYFCGVELEIDPLAAQPKLICQRNQVHYM